jgi:hypothetical protein
MHYTLRFANREEYDSKVEGITVGVALSWVRKEPVRLVAKIDTGASDCLFQRRFADALELDLEGGQGRWFSTVAGRFETFGHEVTIRVLDTEVISLVYFFADYSIKRNVLGRRGWLDRVRIAIVDYDSMLYLSPHDQA